MGFQANGAAQEFFPVPKNLIVPLPDSMSPEQGAMVEPTAVAVHALRRSGDITGKTVLVLGAGPIGNLVAQCARGLGACSVMITDLSDFRLQIARKCGIEHTVLAGRENLDEAITKIYGEDRSDLIMECVGAQHTIAEAVSNARKGSTIVVVGVFGEKPASLSVVPETYLTVVGPNNEWSRSLDEVGRNYASFLYTRSYSYPPSLPSSAKWYYASLQDVIGYHRQ